MRVRLAILAGTLTLGALVGFTGIANAASCSPGTVYPPSSCAVGVSRSFVAAGGTLIVAGTGFLGESRVDVYLHSRQVLLGYGTADGSGNFRLSVTIPADTTPGRHQIIESGLNPDGSPRLLTDTISVTLRITTTAAAVFRPTSTGGLPFTGAQIVGMSTTGAFLVFGGVGMLLVARRRRAASFSS